ncbi:hypothetical protein NGM33_24395 [Nocardiopsis dassonvillei]|uniref:hypothetical protein n=1 Tax=Nocardiopsis dassonvillei TaxID=2014 RepID=UPI0020A2758F|nr:hypothetical protein [Nocardiopsis dassonvillei]MCP3016472.1 hypothetical protein [Nocardiopsis dassonvillei]
MRKHHKRWVALLGAAAIASSGLAGLPGAVAADEKDMRTLAWPEISQSVSSYSLDGYEIGYLPAELERHGIHASTTTDRLGNRQSQLSWMRGPDQLLGRVSILRSDSMRQLDDLRERRYGHLPERTLERLDSGEALRSEAYLSPETGDLFWLDEPGVAVALYLQPDKWSSGELVRMAESLTRKEEAPAEGNGEPAPEGPGSQEPAAEEPAQDEPDAQEPAQEGSGGEADGAEGSGGETGGAASDGDSGGEAGAEAAQEPAGAESPQESAEAASGATGGKESQEPAGADESTSSADGTPVGTSPVGRPETPETPEAAQTSETSQTPESPSEQGGETAQEQPATGEGAQQAPAETGGTAGSERPGATRVRMAKECVVSRFVSFGTGETRLGEMPPASTEFVERAVAAERLGDGDLDRLLATVWYYGDEGVKTGAVEHCAEDVQMSRTELEGLISDLGEMIAVLVEEAEKHDATHEENVARTLEEVNATLPVEVDAAEVLDPIGAQEWAELAQSVPWSFPTGTS